jgi:hypothetical protein
MAVTMRIAVFLDVTPCSLADRYSHLVGIRYGKSRIGGSGIWKGRHGMGLWVNQQEIVVQSGSYTDRKYRGKIKRRKERWVRHSAETLKMIKNKFN